MGGSRKRSLKRQVQAGEPRSVIGQTVEKIEELLGATGAILCMPAILMTRLHPTHRGAGTVALPLGPLLDWLKMKNPNTPAVKREAEEDWAR